jgi:hypothetical protein
MGGASGLVSVPNLPEPSPSLFSQLTVRNQSRVSFGAEETANLLWCSHLISSGHFFTTLNIITNVLLFWTSHVQLCHETYSLGHSEGYTPALCRECALRYVTLSTFYTFLVTIVLTNHSNVSASITYKASLHKEQ